MHLSHAISVLRLSYAISELQIQLKLQRKKETSIMVVQEQNKVVFYSFDSCPKGVCFWGMGVLNHKRFCFAVFKNCWTEWL